MTWCSPLLDVAGTQFATPITPPNARRTMSGPGTRAGWSTVRWFAYCVVFLSALVYAADEPRPALSHTLFDNLPSRIFYFDDSPVSFPPVPNNSPDSTSHSPILTRRPH